MTEGEPGKVNQIKLSGWDSLGPEGENSSVASFAFLDPEKPETSNEYCVGFDFKGGILSGPENWEFHHATYWDHDAYPYDIDLATREVTREELEQLLGRYDIAINDLLARYCQALRFFDEI